ncbi:hypothetical protein CAI21_00170 [Alkalilimnicola ehrlichii]|uniref:Uncharacterized protein n=2 Tax=Alkalilimnicola ehrlichii TaxID=351052 RepID=A0A3E0X282_9GAMM|nr:hypothetical protein CAI21_00170 [Alkalilimnicola ehrlichii]RFA39597.1 hypothetical protein CAL65_02235 [Alkalilimnicola ehrlichii]
MLGVAQSGHAALNLDRLEKLDEPAMADIRGGYINRDGLHVSFSFEHLVKVNDKLEHHLQFHLPSTNLAAGPAQLAENLRNGITQSLPGGDVANAAPNLHTIIQNALDNQAIDNLRVLDIDIEGADQLARMGQNARLQPYLVEALR